MRKRSTDKKKSTLPLPQADIVSKQSRPFQVSHPGVEKTEDASKETAADIQARLEHADRFGHDLTQPILQRQVDTAEKEEEEETPIQAKLTLGQPEDKEEEEADDVAQRVMAMPEEEVKEEDEDESGEQIAPALQKKKTSQEFPLGSSKR